MPIKEKEELGEQALAFAIDYTLLPITVRIFLIITFPKFKEPI